MTSSRFTPGRVGWRRAARRAQAAIALLGIAKPPKGCQQALSQPCPQGQIHCEAAGMGLWPALPQLPVCQHQPVHVSGSSGAASLQHDCCCPAGWWCRLAGTVSMQSPFFLPQHILLTGMCPQTTASNSSNLMVQPRVQVHTCLVCAGLHAWPQKLVLESCLLRAAGQQRALTSRP